MKYITSFFLFIFFLSCANRQSAGSVDDAFSTIVRRHFNVIIVPDLSNRLYTTNPPKDDGYIVQQFIRMLYPDVINDDSKINQNDIFRLDFINKLHIKEYQSMSFVIDLKQFKKNQQRRNEYLGINEVTSSFKKDTALFVKNFKDLISSVDERNSHGADIYAYFANLDHALIDTSIEDIVDSENREIIHNYYENMIILLTDGYIETANENNPHYTLSQNKVNEFRRDYIQNAKGLTVEEFLAKNRQYSITRVKNDLLKFTKVLVMQLYDRGKTPGGNKHEQLSDIIIIKAIWKDWLIQSGMRSQDIALYSCDESYDEITTRTIFKTFLQLK